jgi:hypothetical protein
VTSGNIKAYHNTASSPKATHKPQTNTKTGNNNDITTQNTDSQSITPLDNRTVDSCRTQTTQNKKNYKKSTHQNAGQLFKLAPKILPLISS